MWVSIEGRLLIFLYRYDQGWVCVKEAGEGAEQRFTKIISFSALSCQRCQPFLSQLSHVNSWFLTTMTEVETNSRLGTRKCRWGQSRAAIWFYSWSKFQFHQQPICFGRFLHLFLSFSLFFLHLPEASVHLHCIEPTGNTTAVYNQGSRNLWYSSGMF